MKILNIMLGKSLGGIEQAFLNYSDALRCCDFTPIHVVHKYSKIQQYVTGKCYTLGNLSQYDPFTILKLRKIIRDEKPDCVITHGNRAATISQYATHLSNIPIISVSHNYSYKKLLQSNAVIAVSKHLYNDVKSSGYKKVYHIPNMIRFGSEENLNVSNYHKPVIIGAIGRFVKQKGFEVFLHALSILQIKGVEFNVVIGGDGDEREYLERLSQKLNLQQQVKFLGWVEDKENFYRNIDIFCSPSLHEPFGIVLLEAFKYLKPIVSTQTEGPSDIIIDKKTGVFCKVNDAESLAEQLEYLINNPKFAAQIAQEGYLNAKNKYELTVVAHQIKDLIHHLLSK